MIYLDTHVVVWLYAGKIEKLSAQARDLVNDSEILISPVVCLELQYLYEIQRITDDSKLIVNDLSDRIGLAICDKSYNTIISNALDYSWSRDPFDRIIVANANVDHDILVTKDKNILHHYEKAVW